jgi:hypothetical protein
MKTGTEFHKHCQSILGKTAAVWGPKRFATVGAMIGWIFGKEKREILHLSMTIQQYAIRIHELLAEVVV